MFVTNNRAQNRFIHYNDGGIIRGVMVKAYETLNLPVITNINQIVINADDAHIREVVQSVNNNKSLQTFTLLPAKTYVAGFTFSKTSGGAKI